MKKKFLKRFSSLQDEKNTFLNRFSRLQNFLKVFEAFLKFTKRTNMFVKRFSSLQNEKNTFLNRFSSLQNAKHVFEAFSSLQNEETSVSSVFQVFLHTPREIGSILKHKDKITAEIISQNADQRSPEFRIAIRTHFDSLKARL